MIKKPELGAKDVFITITGKKEGIKQAQYIMANIVKSNMHKLNLVSGVESSSEGSKNDNSKDKKAS